MKNLGRVSHKKDITTIEYLDDKLKDYLPKADMTIPQENIATIDMLPVESEFVKKIDIPNDLVHEADLQPYALKSDMSGINSHVINKVNPHGVTKAQVGLGNVDNIKQASKGDLDSHIADTDRHVSTSERKAWNAKQAALTSGENIDIVDGVISAIDTVYDDTSVKEHLLSVSNPHNVTADQIGLENVDNTSDKNKPVSDATKVELDSKVNVGDETEVYSLILRDNVLRKNVEDSNISPSFINAKIKLNKGTVNEDAFGYFVIYEVEESSVDVKLFTELALSDAIDSEGKYIISDSDFPYVVKYTSTAPESSATYHIDNTNTIAIKVEWYKDIGLRDMRASATIPVMLGGYVTPQALQEHSENSSHISSGERDAWNSKTDDSATNIHIAKKDNPHSVTKSQVGLGNVDNIKQATKAEFDTHNADTTKHVTKAERDAWNAKQGNLSAGSNVTITGGVISATDTIYNDTDVKTHMSSKTNPHGVTKAQVGLGSVTNVAQASKTEFDAHNTDTVKHITATERNTWNAKQNALGFTPENVSNKGQANGYASLDSGGKVPASELPSYVDDVVEGDTLSNLPTTGETGKIYVTINDNKTYRWSGTGYTEISASLALGTTSSTAYRGDLGNIAYNHSQSSGNPHNTTKAHVGLGNVDNTSDINKPVSSAVQLALDKKADSSQVLTNVPANAKFTDTVYTHPSSHPASMITESSTKRFVTDSEKANWNTKTDDTTVDAHIAKEDNPHAVTKSQVGLGNVANISQASKSEFLEHSGDTIRHTTALEKATWDAKQDTIVAGDNVVKTGNTISAVDTVYTHPSTHPASMITESSTKRFVTDTEKSNWNSKTDDTTVNTHIAKKDNPHSVTKAQVGLANVDNVKQATKAEFDTHNADTTKHITKAERDAWNAKQGNLTAGTNVSISGGVISATDTVYDDTTVQSHIASKANPHGTTKAQVGLGNVDNTSDVNKPVSTAMQTALDGKVDNSQVLTNVPSNAKFTDTVYTHPSSHPASMITESSTKRFVTDAEKANWNNKTDDTTVDAHIAKEDNPHNVTKAQVGLGSVSNVLQASKADFDSHVGDATHVTSTEKTTWNNKQNSLTAGANITISENTISAVNTNTTYSVATTSANGLMSSTDKVKLNGIATGANNYTHPSSHPASMITQDSSNRFVTDAEKFTWNGKQNALTAGANVSITGSTISATNTTYGLATTSSNGLMSAADKVKLNGLSEGGIGGGGGSANSILTGVEWNILGDSITAGYDTTKTYHSYIADDYSMTVNNYGMNGSDISSGGTQPNPFVSRYSSMSLSANVITIFGGVNDFFHNVPMGEFSSRNNNTFYGALHNLLNGVKNTYPRAKIGFVTPLQTAYFDISGTSPNAVGKTLIDYVNAIKEVCLFYGIPVLDLHNAKIIDPFITSERTNLMPDGLHPNADGHKKISVPIEHFLEYLVGDGKYIYSSNSDTHSLLSMINKLASKVNELEGGSPTDPIDPTEPPTDYGDNILKASSVLPFNATDIQINGARKPEQKVDDLSIPIELFQWAHVAGLSMFAHDLESNNSYTLMFDYEAQDSGMKELSMETNTGLVVTNLYVDGSLIASGIGGNIGVDKFPVGVKQKHKVVYQFNTGASPINESHFIRILMNQSGFDVANKLFVTNLAIYKGTFGP